mgnify:CR=1 FL=1
MTHTLFNEDDDPSNSTASSAGAIFTVIRKNEKDNVNQDFFVGCKVIYFWYMLNWVSFGSELQHLYIRMEERKLERR